MADSKKGVSQTRPSRHKKVWPQITSKAKAGRDLQALNPQEWNELTQKLRHLSTQL